MVEVTCHYVHHTAAAVMITRNGEDDDEVLPLPLSQIELGDVDLDLLDRGQAITIDVADWLAQKEGLI